MPESRRPPRRKRRSPDAQDRFVATLALDGELDSHDLEALQLELRALARAHGLEVTDIEIETGKRGSGRRS